MKNFLTMTFLALLLSGTVLAQDQKARLTQAITADEYFLEAQVFSRYVDLEMSPEWWALMLDPDDKSGARTSVIIITTNLISLAKRMGLGDAAKESGTVSADGSNYAIKVPGYASWNQSKIDKVMKLGR